MFSARAAAVVGVAALVAVAAVAFEGSGSGASGRAGNVGHLIPSDADVIVHVDVPTMRQLLVEPLLGRGYTPAAGAGMWGHEDLEAEVRALLLDRVGVHVHDADRLTAFFSGGGRYGAVLIEGDFEGQLKAGRSEVVERNGARIFVLDPRDLEATMVGDVIVIGSPEAIDTVVLLSKGQGTSLEKDEAASRAHGRAAEALEMAGGLVVTMSAASIDLDKYTVATDGARLESAGLGLDGTGTLRAAVIGDEKAVTRLEDHLRSALTMASSAASANEKQQIASGDTLEALGAIFADHQVKMLREMLIIDRSGETLAVRLEGVAAGSLPLVGILAATAVPAFLRYQDRAEDARYEIERRQREQEEALRKLREGTGDDDDADE